jgi:DNA repair ATPase RecN
MSDAFTDAFALLAAAADVKGCEARITKLKKLSEQVAAEQSQLDADREVHARTVAAVDEREKALHGREVAVAIAERNLIKDQQALAADRRALAPTLGFDPNMGPGSIGPGGITREPYRE